MCVMTETKRESVNVRVKAEKELPLYITLSLGLMELNGVH